MSALTLVIDQGTHATRAFAFDQDGRVQASSYCPIALHRISPDMIEQDADEIIASLRQVIAAIFSNPVVSQMGVAQAALASQRSSVAAWDKVSGAPLAPILSWQDRRVDCWLKQFDSLAPQIKERTGLPLSPHYGAGKLRWLWDHVPAVKKAQQNGRLAYGPFASFLLFHLLQQRPLLVDHANAARTQLWNIDMRDWDPWLLDLFGVPAGPLPACQPISHEYGRLQGTDIPVTAVNGDQNAAVYSLGQPKPGTAIVNLGTGAFVMLPTGGQRMRHARLLSGLIGSSARSGEYTIEGTVNGSGSAVSWAAETWQIENITGKLAGWLAQSKEPPIFLNSIGGLGSPWWQPGPEPVIVGSGDTGQRVVALLESILFLLQANLDTMAAAGLTITNIRVGGGLARLDGLCQRLANLTGRVVYRPTETEATARGVAWLAAGRPLRWPEAKPGIHFNPEPDANLSARYQRFCHELKRHLEAA